MTSSPPNSSTFMVRATFEPNMLWPVFAVVWNVCFAWAASWFISGLYAPGSIDTSALLEVEGGVLSREVADLNDVVPAKLAPSVMRNLGSYAPGPGTM